MKIGDKVTVRDWSYSRRLDVKTGALVEPDHDSVDNRPFTVTAVGLHILTEQWLSKDKYADTAIRDKDGTIIYTQERFLEPVVDKPFIDNGRRYILRRKVKQYRPWKRDEVPYGTPVRWKDGGNVYFLAPATNNGYIALVWGGGGGESTLGREVYTARGILKYAIQLDGAPCGVEE